MPGPHLGSGLTPDASWIAKDLADIERELSELRAARTLENAQVGRGGLVVTDDTTAASTAAATQLASDKANGAKGGSILVADSGGVIWDSFRDLAIPRAWLENSTGLNYTGSATEYMGSQLIPVPYGMSTVTLTGKVSAGETLSSGTGSISVAAVLRQLDASGTTLQDNTGTAITSGAGSGPIVTFAFAALEAAIHPGCTQFQLGVSVQDAISGTRSPNSGDWQGTCFALFSRGARSLM